MRDIKLKKILDIVKYEVEAQLDDVEDLPPLISLSHLVESLGDVSKALNKNDDKLYVNSMVKASALVISTLRIYMDKKGIDLNLEDESSE